MHDTEPKLQYADSEDPIRMFGCVGHQGSLLHCAAHMYSFLLPRRPWSVVYDLGVQSFLRPVSPIFIGKYDVLANELVQCRFSLFEPMPRSKM